VTGNKVFGCNSGTGQPRTPKCAPIGTIASGREDMRIAPFQYYDSHDRIMCSAR
jgi:hypothetical protein